MDKSNIPTMSQDNHLNPSGGAKKHSLIDQSVAAKGYVATQQSLYSLINDLLATVKGIRKEQKEQAEKIAQLTERVDDQQRELDRLKRRQAAPKREDDSGEPIVATTKDGPAAADLAQLRRELVGMIGMSLANHEEEYHEAKEEESSCVGVASALTTTNHLRMQAEWEEFRSSILPRQLTRTFHSNGTAILRSSSTSRVSFSYIDYPLTLTPTLMQPSTYSWSVQAQGGQWAVGIATISSVSKWDNNATDYNNNVDKSLGDAKGEWAYRSDGTWWSHNKLRQTFNTPHPSDSPVTLTVTLEFHPTSNILIKGSIEQQPSIVWFDIPWKKFKNPTSFVPSASVQNESAVRFRQWEI